MEIDQRLSDRGHAGRQFADLRQWHGFTGLRLGQRIAQIRDQPRLVIVREELHVDAEHRIDLEQHRYGERPLVLLELAEVAGRQAERVGKGRLRHAAFLAQRSQPYPHECLAHYASCRVCNICKSALGRPQNIANPAISVARRVADIADGQSDCKADPLR